MAKTKTVKKTPPAPADVLTAPKTAAASAQSVKAVKAPPAKNAATAAAKSATPKKPVAKAPVKTKPIPPQTKAAPNPAIEAVPPTPESPKASTASDTASEARAAFETLSVNLARAALTAQSVIAEAALRNAENPSAVSADPFHVMPAFTEVMGRLVASPDRLLRAQADLFTRYMDLWTETAKRAGGMETQPVAAPVKGDRRFSDPQWSENPMFDAIKQSYLVTSDWLNTLVASVDQVDPMTKRRAEFFTKLLTDAFSPSNFLASNPAALRKMIETQGESLVKGMQNLAEDFDRGGGRLAIRQTDYARFKVGENVATAPGKVVWRDTLFELLQFSPSTPQQHQIPLLIFPPWINKYYILDLRPENSLVRWLTAQGFTVFVAAWVNPDPSLANETFEDYMRDGIYQASSQVMKQCGVDQINVVGYCIGGTLLGCTLAHMAEKDDARIASATFFAAQHDFSEAGDLLLFTNEDWLNEIEKRMDEHGGVLPGGIMSDTFNALRANDLIWSFFVNNYLMGEAPKPFDLLYWNGDQTCMPKALHLFYLRKFYGENALAKGQLMLDGVKIDPQKVKIPLYFQAAREDHIAPMRSVYKSAKLFGSEDITYMLSGSGHIAGVINPPSSGKYQHWTNAKLPETLEAWQRGAREHAGSWWPHWADWLRLRSGPLQAARDPANGVLTPLGDAPGEYVKVKR